MIVSPCKGEFELKSQASQIPMTYVPHVHS